MTLTNPFLDYIAQVRDPIIALLKANMSTLNIGLTGGTFTGDGSAQIIPGFPQVTPVMSSQYPVIMVKWAGKDEQPLQLGKAGRKKAVVKMRLFALVDKVDPDIDYELAKLCTNIEAVFRQNISIGDNVLFADPLTTDPIVMATDGVYVHVAAIDINCTVEVV